MGPQKAVVAQVMASKNAAQDRMILGTMFNFADCVLIALAPGVYPKDP